MRKFKNGEKVTFSYIGNDGNKHIGYGTVRGLRKRFYYIETEPHMPHVKVYGNKIQKRINFQNLLKPTAKMQTPSVSEQIQTKLILETKNHIQKAINMLYYLSAFLVFVLLVLLWTR